MQFGYANQYPSTYSSAPQQPQLEQQQPPPTPYGFGFGMQPNQPTSQMQTTQMQAAPIVVPLVDRAEMRRQYGEYNRKIFNDKYPTAVALVFAFLIAAMCGLLIGMQSVLITSTSDSTRNGEAGLWAGAVGLLFVLAIVITALSKSYCAFVLSSILNIFSIIAFLITTMLSGIALATGSYKSTKSKSSSSRTTTTTTTTTKATSTSDLSSDTLYTVLVVAGAVGFVLSLAYIITISCIFGKRRRQTRAVGMTGGAQMMPLAPMPMPNSYGQVNSYPMSIASQQQQQQQQMVYASQFDKPAAYY